MRLRRIVKRGAIVLAITAGVVLVWSAWNTFQSSRRLHQRMAALAAAQEPVTFAEISAPPIRRNENAAAVLARLREDLVAVYRDCARLEEDKSASYFTGKPFASPLTGDGAQLVEKALEPFPQLIENLEFAAECPGYAPRIDFAKPPTAIMEAQLERLQTMRAAAKVLYYRALLSLYQERRDEACHCGVTGLKLARQFDHEPFVVSYLVALATRSIALSAIADCLKAGPLTPATRDLLEKELAMHDPMSGWTNCLQTERVFGLESFQEKLDGPLRAAWWYQNDLCDYLDLMAQHVQWGAEPRYKIATAKSRAPTGVLTRLTQPSIDAARTALDRTRAQLRATRAVNAVQRFAAEHGMEPTSLDDLQLPKEATVDPFSGKPLLVVKSDEGWMIYSVGPDLEDNGGAIDTFKDIGVGPIPAVFSRNP